MMLRDKIPKDRLGTFKKNVHEIDVLASFILQWCDGSSINNKCHSSFQGDLQTPSAVPTQLATFNAATFHYYVIHKFMFQKGILRVTIFICSTNEIFYVAANKNITRRRQHAFLFTTST